MYGLNSFCFRGAPVINLSCMLTLCKTLCMHTLLDLLHRCNFDKVLGGIQDTSPNQIAAFNHVT